MSRIESQHYCVTPTHTPVGAAATMAGTGKSMRCMLALTLLFGSHCITAWNSVPRVNEELEHLSDFEFRQLVQDITSGSVHQRHGAKRALLQRTGFDADFFNILEPLLQGNTSMVMLDDCFDLTCFCFNACMHEHICCGT